MHILGGNGLQEGPEDVLSHYDRIYTHPYFGQTFLAGALAIIGYPDSLHPSAGDVHSIEMLWLIPRVIMGLLAVVDTFLVYKIAERRYTNNNNKTIALVASVLFAVMPISWITRMVLLDSILLPFLLSSILFADYLKDSKYNHNSNKKIAIIFLSGIFLGLAIFTKIPAFTVIPLVGVLIYTNSSSHKLRNLGLWFIPVVSIPLIWPGYSLAAGQHDQWLDGVLWQAGRGGEAFNGLSKAIYSLFKMDPMFIVLGFAGLIFAAIKRDFYPLLWAVPFIIFMYLIGYVSYWFLIPLLLPLCIAAATMIVGLPSRIFKKEVVQRISPFAIISAIGIFGLISTSMLITLNMNFIHFQVQATLTQYLAAMHNADDDDDDKEKKVFIMARPTYLWILKHAFDKGNHHDHQSYYNLKKIHRSISQDKYKKFIFIVDGRFKADLRKNTTKQHLKEIQALYNNLPTLAKINIKNTNSYDANQYPYSTNLKMMGKGWGRVEIRTNY